MGLAGRFCVGAFALLILGIAGAAAFIWSIQSEKNSEFLRGRFVEMLNAGLGPGNVLLLDEAGMRLSGANPTFSIAGLSVTNPQTGAQAELDRVDFGLSKGSLWRLSPEARTVRFEGLRLVLPNARASGNPLVANEILTLLRATLGAVHFATSGQDPAFATLNAIEGRDIALFRREDDARTTLIQSGLTASVTREGEGRIVARIKKQGSGAVFELAARSTLDVSGVRVVTVESTNLAMAQLAELLGAEVPAGVDPGLRGFVKLRSEVGADSQLKRTSLSIGAHGGRITPPDADMTPFDLKEASVELSMAPGSDDVAIDRIAVRFDETHIEASGSMRPENAGGIRLSLGATRAELGRPAQGAPVLALDKLILAGSIAPNLRTFALDSLGFAKDAGEGRLSGRFSLDDDGLIEAGLEAGGFDIRHALRIWPVWVAPNVRNWLLIHAPAGKLASLSLKSRLAGDALRDAQNRRPIPDEALNVVYRFEGLTLLPVMDAAPVQGITATGISTGRRAAIDIETGWLEPKQGQRVEIRGAKLVVADTAQKPAILEMSIPARGKVDGLLTFLAAPSLRAVAGSPGELAIADGVFDGKATLVLPLSSASDAKDARFEVRAELRQVAINNLMRDERLEAGAFTLTGRSGQITAKGEGRLFGVPSQIEFRAEAGKPATATARATLDEAALAKRGLDLRPALAGSITGTLSMQLGRSGAPQVDIDFDLSKAKVELAAAGISKRAGLPGRAKFALVNRPDGGTHFDALEIDMGTTSIRGRVELAKDGQFVRAELASLKLSPGDNARVSVERARGVTRVTLRGNSFDIRPFLRGLFAGKTDDGKSADFDLDLQSTVLVGFNGELMSAAEAKAARRQGRLTQLTFKSQFSGAPATANIIAQTADSITIRADSQDAGGLIRFLDIYSRAHGGRMTADIIVKAGSQQGIVQMRDFSIRGEPGLRQIASGTGRPGQPIPSENVEFTKFRAEFTRIPGKLELHEAVMWGGQIGGSIEGTLDYAGDSVNLKGAFVPAYGLNNLFAQVPLLGPILGGGQYEGLFAVPFVIQGKASAPTLRTNPVSAIAPGFLRKLFEIQKVPQ